jgi:hypothetical protein
MKTEILTQVIQLGMDAYMERAQKLIGRRTLEGKQTSVETIERLQVVMLHLIALSEDPMLSKSDLLTVLENLG